jgi:hypothetical protein
MCSNRSWENEPPRTSSSYHHASSTTSAEGECFALLSNFPPRHNPTQTSHNSLQKLTSTMKTVYSIYDRYGLYMDCIWTVYGCIWDICAVYGPVWVYMDCIRTVYRLYGASRLVYGLYGSVYGCLMASISMAYTVNALYIDCMAPRGLYNKHTAPLAVYGLYGLCMDCIWLYTAPPGLR